MLIFFNKQVKSLLHLDRERNIRNNGGNKWHYQQWWSWGNKNNIIVWKRTGGNDWLESSHMKMFCKKAFLRSTVKNPVVEPY